MSFKVGTQMNYCNLGLAVIEIEAQAILELSQRINQDFAKACDILLKCKGRVVVTGMGKSGHIGKKIAATLASTGTPAFFMHPGEASHGDLGMITKNDVVVAISKSGKTREIVVLLPILKRLNVPLVAITGSVDSIIANTADCNLDITVKQEACPLGLAPTTSTTASLVMGDALAIALLEARGFSSEDFARSHPGGALGQKLLVKIDKLYHNRDFPTVNENITIREALIEVTDKKLGMTCVVNSQGKLSGVFTDGDVRRTLLNNHNIDTTAITEVMSKVCKTTTHGTLAAEALATMQEHAITSLVVVDNENRPIGVLHMHDLLRSSIY